MLTSVRDRSRAVVRFVVPGFRRVAATLALAGALAARRSRAGVGDDRRERARRAGAELVGQPPQARRRRRGRWGSLGKEVLGAPSASWSGDGRKLTVAAVGADHLAWHRTWTNGLWGAWMPLNTNPGSALPTSQPPLLTTLGARLSDAQASDILTRVGEESVTAKPQATGLVAALSSFGAAPAPSGSFPHAPSGSPPG